VPNNIASGWANYRFTEGALRGLQLGGGLRYVGETFGNETNTFKVPAVTLVDAAIRYDFGARFERLTGLEATVNASNLGDKEYISSCNAATNCYFGNRRTILAGLRARW
jgi:iron complex outermembrane receptor protein